MESEPATPLSSSKVNEAGIVEETEPLAMKVKSCKELGNESITIVMLPCGTIALLELILIVETSPLEEGSKSTLIVVDAPGKLLEPLFIPYTASEARCPPQAIPTFNFSLGVASPSLGVN